MTLNRERFALPSLAATFVVQTTAAMAMFGVSVLAPVAAPDIGVEATLVGVFTGIAYGSGLAVGLLSGRLADRFGALRISQATMVFAFFGCLLLAVSTPLSALASAISLGLCYGPVNPLSTHILSRVASERSRPLYFSIKQTGMPAGAALAGLVLPPLVAAYNWQVAIASVGVAAAVVSVLVQPLRGPLDSIREPKLPIRLGSFIHPLLLVWETPMLRRLGLMGFTYSGVQVAIMSFYVLYLIDDLSFSYTGDTVDLGISNLSSSLPAVGFVFAVLQISAVFGRLFWGAVADRIIGASPLLVGIGLATATFTVLAGAMAENWPFWSVTAVSFLVGFTSSGWNGLFFSELVRFSPAGKTGDAAAGLQFATLSGVTVVPALFGLVVTLADSYFMAFASAGLLVCVGASQFGYSLRR
ncbi:MAG: hypothetical protein CFH10_00414 [Alphaproteobacteria bacterium MarineAlpha4_Bin2]|nr:MAG: hypothetical protein CFH10_00414 [Alphaproteobacteria bacterium MarineAlpha4_Bin2]